MSGCGFCLEAMDDDDEFVSFRCIRDDDHEPPECVLAVDFSTLPISGPGCWCGETYGHDWPGKGRGAPHPKDDRCRKCGALMVLGIPHEGCV